MNHVSITQRGFLLRPTFHTAKHPDGPIYELLCSRKRLARYFKLDRQLPDQRGMSAPVRVSSLYCQDGDLAPI